MRADGSGGAPRNPRLTALWTVDASAAAAEVRHALENASTVEAAARALNIPTRTLYRWILLKNELRSAPKGTAMTPRELRGAINRAKTVYVYCHYNTVNAFFTKVSKEAAREVADDAKEEGADVEAAFEDGHLYIGHVPPDEAIEGEPGTETDSEEEENDDDE